MLKDYKKAIEESCHKPCKTLVKRGTLDIGMVETTPVVWKNRVCRFEWVRNNQWGYGYWKNDKEYGYYRFTDRITEESTSAFALDHSFGCACIEGDTAYALGVRGSGGGNMIDVFYSKDLENWESKIAIEFTPDFMIYNNSVCKGPDGYMMAIEIKAPAEIAGRPFTNIFAKSQNLLDWEVLPPDQYVYTKDRYSACPVIRYADGYYYMIYLESMPCARWAPYIVRSADLIDYELGLVNPIMFFDDRDKIVLRPEKFSNEQLSYIESAIDCNNSDVDLCEYNGKTIITYSWGNQHGKEFLAEAEYDGPMEEFLKSFF